MLVATITAILIIFGMGGSISYDVLDIIDAAEDAVDDNIRDEARKEQLLTTLKHMELETVTFTRDIQTHRKDILKLDLNPTATREEYISVFRRLHARWIGAEEVLLDGVFKLRADVSAEEWTVLNEAIQEDLED